MITNFKRSTRREIITAAALLAVLSIAFLTEPRSLPAQSGERNVGDSNAAPVGEFRVAVVGHVARPGFYASIAPTTVLEILTRSKGPLAEADVENIIVVRKIDGKEMEFLFNYKDVSQGKNMHQNLLLEHEDIIVVPILTSPGAQPPSGIRELPKIIHHEEAEKRLTALEQGTSTGSFQPPELLERSFPIYTEEARKARIEGVLILKGTVRRNGMVDNIEVLRGLGYGLDEAAIRAFADSRFRPATRDDVPEDYSLTMEFSFALYRP